MIKKVRDSLIGLIVALIPLWIFLLIVNFVSPVGFWQGFAVLVIGIVILGGVQLFFLVLWIMYMMEEIWSRESEESDELTMDWNRSGELYKKMMSKEDE